MEHPCPGSGQRALHIGDLVRGAHIDMEPQPSVEIEANARVAGASIPHRAQDAAELVGYRALRHTGALFDDRGLDSFG